MKLTEFLKLSFKEENLAKELLLYKSANSVELYRFIVKIDLILLIKLALIYPEIDIACKSSMLSSHWDIIWKASGKKMTAKEKKPIEFAPMSNISSFDLLKGLLLHQTYRTMVDSKEISPTLFADAKEFLELSAKQGCFFALNALCQEGLKLLAAKPDFNLARAIIGHAKKAAELYGTAGYFLLANVYQEVSKYTKELTGTTDNLPQEFLFKEALVALNVAQQLEEQSADKMTNAYLGKTLQEVSDNQFVSWYQFKIRLEKLSGGLLNTKTQLSAIKQAKEFSSPKTFTSSIDEKEDAKSNTFII